jgi:hypothetical protein
LAMSGVSVGPETEQQEIQEIDYDNLGCIVVIYGNNGQFRL